MKDKKSLFRHIKERLSSFYSLKVFNFVPDEKGERRWQHYQEMFEDTR